MTEKSLYRELDIGSRCQREVAVREKLVLVREKLMLELESELEIDMEKETRRCSMRRSSRPLSFAVEVGVTC